MRNVKAIEEVVQIDEEDKRVTQIEITLQSLVQHPYDEDTITNLNDFKESIVILCMLFVLKFEIGCFLIAFIEYFI